MTNNENMLDDLKKRQLMVAIRTDTPEQAYRTAIACADGGVKYIEITFSVPGAEEVIAKLGRDGRIAVGAGTVLTVEEGRKALAAGATYLVSPNFDEAVVAFAKKEGVVSIPGASTPTEIYRAYKAGGDVIKLFPFVELGGLAFLKAMRGPFPYVPYLLCGGANLDNVSSYLAAKAAGILIGTAIVKRDLIVAKDWNGITSRARAFVEKVAQSQA